MRRAVVVSALVIVVALLLTAGTALAQNPVQGGYGPASVTPPSQGSGPTHTSGSLPFTGFDAGLLAMVGLGLAGLGVVVRVALRRSQS